jgi:hypothetical protein
MVTALKVIKSGKKKYFVDCRLGEVRNVKNPHDRVEFDYLSEKMVKKIPHSCFMKYFNR